MVHFVLFSEVYKGKSGVKILKKKVFDDTGCSGIWRNQDFPNSEWLISSIKLSLNDQFKQDW
jgi:hypothetical protein